MTPTATGTSVRVTPDQVHATLAKHMLADGFDFVLDLDKSQGVWLHDSRGNKTLMDFFSFFASNPVGMNHPGIKNPEFQARLVKTLSRDLRGRSNVPWSMRGLRSRLSARR